VLLRQLIYRFYTRHLEDGVRAGRLPSHIGLILDGNRRFAREMGFLDVVEGHRRGADKVEEVLNWCEDLGIPMVTIWILSTENLSRPADELNALLGLIERKLREAAVDPKIHRKQVRIRAIGRLEMLPASMQEAIRLAEEATRDYVSFFLNVAVGYGGRQEIADAISSLMRERAAQGQDLRSLADEISPDLVGKYLYTYELPDPELIIRTSGELRLSGFLLWQSAYSEYYFCDAYWPSFRKIDFLRAIRSYQQRERRFGS